MTLTEILDRAQRRMLAVRFLAVISASGAITLAGIALVLIFGTNLISWWVPVLVFLIAFGIDGISAWTRAPQRREVASLLDRRCDLSDSLATAVYFQDQSSGVAVAQRQQAEVRAQSIDLVRSFPFVFPRSLYLCCGLGAIALGLFAWRFGTERSLNLTVPIANMNLDALVAAIAPADRSAEQRRASSAKSTPPTTPEGVVNRLGTSTPDNPNEKDTAGSSETAVTSGQQQAKAEHDGAPSADGKKSGGPREQASETGEAGSAAPKQDPEQPPSTHDGAPQNAQASSKPGGTPDSSGLMSKIREAVSNLVSKMKPQGNQAPPGGQQTAQQPNGKPPAGQQPGAQQGKPDANGKPSDQDGQESASSDDDPMAPGKGKGKSSDQSASAKPGSGMGHQDGSKDLKDAEQMNAMGKLSEIIGKRSANVTGEMTIEPQNGPQQLKTGYTHSSARHGEASGDINRDEVPLALQSYVQQYYEQVRKQPPSKTKRLAN